MPPDPIQHLEKKVKELHDKAGNLTQPVLRRYPLLFAFLLTFSVAAILHGFELWSDGIALFREHPLYLLGLGVVLLALTGTLYKALAKVG